MRFVMCSLVLCVVACNSCGDNREPTLAVAYEIIGTDVCQAYLTCRPQAFQTQYMGSDIAPCVTQLITRGVGTQDPDAPANPDKFAACADGLERMMCVPSIQPPVWPASCRTLAITP